jgi:DUF1365 family protein
MIVSAMAPPGTLFPPPEESARFYVGPVMHARLKPKAHRFSYAVFSLLIDLDRLGEADRLSRYFSVGRFNLISFDLAPHGLTKGAADPAQGVRQAFAKAGLTEPISRLMLLCYPRVLGFVFNPLSVYFAYGARGQLMGVLYEVHNTFGERHSYIEPVEPGQLSEAGLRQETDKLFYVSPFLGPRMRYHFRLRPPTGEQVAIRIHETDSEGPILAATFHGRGEAITNQTCWRLARSLPLMTIKVVLGIHYEALRLWIKGITFHSRPAPPPPASMGGQFVSVVPDTKLEG